MDDLKVLCDTIEQRFRSYTGRRLFTVAISGIDASGKGYITKLLQDGLEARGYSVASINIDPWQNPIPVRLQENNAALNFYHNAFRWDDFIGKLIVPLQTKRKIRLETELIHTHADEYFPFTYDFEQPAILLIEGIFLFQKKYVSLYDLKIWVNCSFETAMDRAVARNVERLDQQRLINDYNTYYFPAQRLHFELDDPQTAADIIFEND